jgi:hypothetical protein
VQDGEGQGGKKAAMRATRERCPGAFDLLKAAKRVIEDFDDLDVGR